MHKGLTDISSGAFIATIALLFLSQSVDLEGVSAILPNMLIIFMLLGSTYLIGLGIVRWVKSKEKEEGGEPIAFNRIYMIGAGSIVYVLIIPVAGFYISSAVFLFAMATLLLNGKRMQKKVVALNVLFAALMCVVVWGGFNVLLSVPTPGGLLF